MTEPKKKQADDRPEVDTFGIGMVDGHVVTLTPAEYAQAKIERDADEAEDEE